MVKLLKYNHSSTVAAYRLLTPTLVLPILFIIITKITQPPLAIKKNDFIKKPNEIEKDINSLAFFCVPMGMIYNELQGIKHLRPYRDSPPF